MKYIILFHPYLEEEFKTCMFPWGFWGSKGKIQVRDKYVFLVGDDIGVDSGSNLPSTVDPSERLTFLKGGSSGRGGGKNSVLPL